MLKLRNKKTGEKKEIDKYKVGEKVIVAGEEGKITALKKRENGQLESVLVGSGHKMMTKAFNRIETVYA